MNNKVDEFIGNLTQWKQEVSLLRNLLLASHLNEEIKWNTPCYTSNSSNVVLIGVFKTHLALSFFKGVLLNDFAKKLHSPGANSQSVMYLKFTSSTQIEVEEKQITAYLKEALEIERLGLKVPLMKNENIELCNELVDVLNQDNTFKKAFYALTQGKQRGYNIFFSGAKQPQTRISRIEKNKQRIVNGFGLHDCTCGLTKRKPNCDGSHKTLSH